MTSIIEKNPAKGAFLVVSLCLMLLLGLITLTSCLPFSHRPSDSLRQNPAGYFDNISVARSVPDDFFIQVGSLQPGTAAAKAGLRAGDAIIGVDGKRVRNLKEYTLFRTLRSRPRVTLLTLVRDGALTTLSIPGSTIESVEEITLTEHTPDFIAALMAANLLTDDLLPVPLPRVKGVNPKSSSGLGLIAGLFKKTQNSDPAFEPDSAIMVAIASFPARGQEEILALLASQSPAHRAWVCGVLKVYGQLLYEKPAEAIRIMDGLDLLKHSPASPATPFLSRLLLFYKALAQHPLTPETPISPALYQVDSAFFALCFPYPLDIDTHTYTFPSDPRFQDGFTKCFNGSLTYRNFSHELNQTARDYIKGGGSDPVDIYLGMVKASVLDSYNHGGWPGRCSLVFSRKQSAAMVAKLKKRMGKKPDERIEFAWALIATSMIAGDEATFTQAYDICMKAGPKISAQASRIVDSAIMGRYDLSLRYWRTVVFKKVTAKPIPGIYGFLQKASPSFNRRCGVGWWTLDYISGGDVVGPSSFCFNRPHEVALALEKPCDTARFLAHEGIPTKEMPAAEFDAIADKWVFIISRNPDYQLIDTCLKLTPIWGAGRTFDVIRRALSHHQQLWQRICIPDGMRIIDLYRLFFADVEKRSFQEIKKALAELDNHDPKLPEKIADLYAKAGVPTTCLLFSKKLKEAGYADLSAAYFQRAVGFWDDMISSSWNYTESHVWACRDITSEPGFRELFDRYVLADGDCCGNNFAIDSMHLYKAVMDSYEGKTEVALQELTRVNDAVLKIVEVVSFYKGNPYPSQVELKAQLEADLRNMGAPSSDTKLPPSTTK